MELADYRRDMIALNRQILALQERERQLEQLVKEAIDLADIYAYPGTRDTDAWLERAKAAIE